MTDQRDRPQLRKQLGNPGTEYVVVLREASSGKPGLQSRAPQLAKAVSEAYSVPARRVYSHAINGFSTTLTDAQAAALSRDPRVEYVEQSVAVSGSAVQFSPLNWGLDRIDARSGFDGAYHYENDGTGVIAYVVDSGIRITHTEFGGRASYGPNFDSSSSGPSSDCAGHGTHVAGILGGATTGVAKNVSLISVRVLNCGNGGTIEDVLAGIDWVTADHVARGGAPAVANMSISTTNPVPWSFTVLEDAVFNSIVTGVTWTLIAGNNADWVFNYSPGRLDAAITAGAADWTDSKASFSNFGPQVDLFAPGVSILSAFVTGDNDYVYGTGTSMAAPFAAGVAARFLQLYWWAPPAHVQNWVVYEEATYGLIPDPGPGTPNRLLYSGFLDVLAPSAVARVEKGLRLVAPPARTGRPALR